MSIRDKKREFEAVRDEYDTYAAAFAADAREKRDPTEFRSAVEETRADFARYGEAFATDVARKRRSIRKSAGALDDYAAAFADDVAEKRNVDDLLADVDSLLGAIESRAERFRTAADGFRTDVEERRGRAATLRDGFADAAAEFATANEEFRAAVAEFRGVEEAELTAVAGGEDRSPSEGSEDSERPVAGGSSNGDGSTGPTDSGEQSGTDPDPDPDPPKALVEELREIEYAKLKKAANRIGYDGNLNAATKDELVSFIADHADQVEEALGNA